MIQLRRVRSKFCASPTQGFKITATQQKAELRGKTIEWAGIVERPSGDAEFLMRFTDGSTAIVAAWKREGHSLQMNIDLSPNSNPQTDSGTMSPRVI